MKTDPNSSIDRSFATTNAMSILLLILCFDPIGGNPPKFLLNLMIGIGGTGLLARDTKDRIHVVVTHVRSLGSNVLRAEGAGKSLLVHCCCICEIESV